MGAGPGARPPAGPARWLLACCLLAACQGRGHSLWLADRGAERLWVLDSRGRLLAQGRFPGARRLAFEPGDPAWVWLGGGLGPGEPTCWWRCRMGAGGRLVSVGPFREPGPGAAELAPGLWLDPLAQPGVWLLPGGRRLELQLGALIERDELGRARWSQGGFGALESLLVLGRNP